MRSARSGCGGASVSPGYYEMPEETAQTFRDGWLLTGDLGVRAADGTLSVVGRKKEIINSGGLKIYPSEVEGVLAKAPGVQVCCVIGVPNDLMGEEPVAFIVLAPGATLESVAAHSRRHLARYKQPRLEVTAWRCLRTTLAARSIARRSLAWQPSAPETGSSELVAQLESRSRGGHRRYSSSSTSASRSRLCWRCRRTPSPPKRRSWSEESTRFTQWR